MFVIVDKVRLIYVNFRSLVYLKLRIFCIACVRSMMTFRDFLESHFFVLFLFINRGKVHVMSPNKRCSPTARFNWGT